MRGRLQSVRSPERQSLWIVFRTLWTASSVGTPIGYAKITRTAPWPNGCELRLRLEHHVLPATHVIENTRERWRKRLSQLHRQYERIHTCKHC